MKIKILIVDSFVGMGGEEEVTYYIYKNINREKFNVKIMAPKLARYFDKHFPIKEEFIDGKVTGKFSILSMIKFRQIIKKEKFDIIHVHGYSAGYFVRISCIGLKLPKIIWTMHINLPDVTAMSRISRKFKTNIENVLSNSKLFTNQIICVSEDAKKSLLNRNIKNTPINVIYNGVDLNIFAKEDHMYNTSKFDKYHPMRIGFISRLSQQKNIPLLLKIANQLRKKNIFFNLFIYGEGEMYDFARDYIKKNKLSNVVHLKGFEKNVYQIMKKIDILILPSLYECFPMIILESMASGVPVIASNVNGIPEIIKDKYNGLLAESDNCEDFCSKIIDLYNNPNSIIKLGIQAKKYIIDNFDKEKMLKEYENIYFKVYNDDI